MLIGADRSIECPVPLKRVSLKRVSAPLLKRLSLKKSPKNARIRLGFS